MRHHILLAILIPLTILSGCRSRLNVAPANQLPTPAEISQQTPAQRFQQLCSAYSDWDDVQIPVKASLKSKGGMSCSGKAVMKRGQWLSISLRMLGFEVASVWVDRDSIHAIDRYHKIYLSESISDALGNPDVTISDVQDLLMGRAFLAGVKGGTLTEPQITQFTLEDSPEGLMLFPKIMPAGLEYGFILSNDANVVAASSVGIDGKYPVSITYSGFATNPYAGLFASQVNIDFPARKFAGTLTWNFTEAKWNTGQQRSWSTPKGYKRISGNQLLRTISTL